MKAVHLELVGDLTTDSFIACLKRFVARRGRSTQLITDNGTNFVGARHELDDIQNLLEKQASVEQLDHYLIKQRITWSHIPGCSPHFGGILEAGVKSMKLLLTKSVGTHTLTVEELNTILTEAEATMNSHPLIPQDSAPSDGVEVLTPGHFLIGRPLNSLPEPIQPDSNISLRKRWNLCQHLSNELWRRWSQEYLHILNRDSRKTKERRNFVLGDLRTNRCTSGPGLSRESSKCIRDPTPTSESSPYVSEGISTNAQLSNSSHSWKRTSHFLPPEDVPAWTRPGLDAILSRAAHTSKTACGLLWLICVRSFDHCCISPEQVGRSYVTRPFPSIANR